MPTLDDSPILEILTSTTMADDDLVLVYDQSEQKIKAITIAQLRVDINV
tara:strand:+ start:673 stop:819 length:147 start_codon:yes stop_codon:yes gene_type:complete